MDSFALSTSKHVFGGILIRLLFLTWVCVFPMLGHTNEFPMETCSNIHNTDAESLTPNRQILDAQRLPLAAPNREIHQINLVQLNVFNTDLPEENNAIFRFANRAHIQTKPEVIRSILLFNEGELYHPEKLIESERLLRQQRYLYDARIYADVACAGDIHVTVVTRDLWTLLPDLGFSHSGGESTSRIGFRETNLLGLGKRLSLTYTKDAERTGYLFVYEDPNILGSRYTGRIDYADNDDGQMHMVALSYPFFATDTPYSYGLTTASNTRVESQYERGDVVNEFEQTSEINAVYFGFSTSLGNDWTRRVLFGYQQDEETFNSVLDTTLELAENRKNSFPFVELNWFENDYVKVRNVDSIFRTEDLQLGWDVRARVGYSDESISNDLSRLLYWFSAQKAEYLTEKSLLKIELMAQGAWRPDEEIYENQLTALSLQYYYNDDIETSWYAGAQYQHINNMTRDQQVTLGGETGLRGYNANYLQGNQKWLLNLERRYYWEYDLWQLFKVGGAAFVDVGKVAGNPLFAEELGWLSDAGVGLRLAPSRANSNTMLHLDVAWPLKKFDDSDSVQWLFTVKNRF
ncbi:conserved protein of unknown function [Pseudoalteromonas luteoviolacea B = ATCC 29581]|nr:conserved protein of unknown function [Pseudoalteromonas luteoviolacea B = ATCC 29581]